MGYRMGVPHSKASKDYSIAAFIRKTPPPILETIIICSGGNDSLPAGLPSKMSEVHYTLLCNPSFHFIVHCSFPFDSPL